jgi:hypothetical protein
MGATILIVWPVDGPGAWIRDRLLRPTLPGKAKAALDCYICLGFWCGLGISLPWWLWYREPWVWLGCLMVPTVFWLVLGQGRA